MGKHTDELIEQLVFNTEGKTNCKHFNSDDWGGYERVLPPEVEHYIGKDKTQTNGKMASTTEQICQGLGTDESDYSVSRELLQLDLATQSSQIYRSFGRAGLATRSWRWHDIATHPTLY